METPVHHTPAPSAEALPLRLPTGPRQTSEPNESLQLHPGSAASGYQTWPANTSMAYCSLSNVSYDAQASVTAGIPPNPSLTCPTTHLPGSEIGTPIMSYVYTPVSVFAQQPLALEAQPQPTAVPGSKMFEVEDVTEVTDSPTPSEDASSNSTVSLDKDGEVPATSSQTDVTVTQEQALRETQTNVSAPVVQGSGGLESASGSSIGVGESSSSVTPTDYHPMAPVMNQTEPSSLAHSATQPNLPVPSQPPLEQELLSRYRSVSAPHTVTSFAQVPGPLPPIPETVASHSIPELEMSTAAYTTGTGTMPLEGNLPSSYPSYAYAPQRPSPNMQPALEQIPPHHAQLLTTAFGKFLHAMNTMLRDPSMEPLIHSLDSQFGEPNLQSPSTSQPSSQPVSPTFASSGPRMSPRVSTTTQVCYHLYIITKSSFKV